MIDTNKNLSEIEIIKSNGTIESVKIAGGIDYDELSNALIEGTLTALTPKELDGFESIGNNAFAGFENLVDVTLPNTIVEIKSGAFQACPLLTNIEIPEGVTTIGSMVFLNCTSLKKITLPSTLTSLYNYAFSAVLGTNRTPLEEVVCLATTPPTVPDASGSAFFQRALFNTTAKIYVPYGTKSLYTSAKIWSKQTASQYIELNEDGSKPE